MKQLLAICALALVLLACNKDKVETKPHLKFKSFGKNPIADAADQYLKINLEFTDQEGDLDSLFIIRQRLNKKGPSYFEDFLNFVPEFGNQNMGEIQLTLEVAREVIFNLDAIDIPGTVPPRKETDTLLFKFYVKDKEGHTSDTASTKPLYVHRS